MNARIRDVFIIAYMNSWHHCVLDSTVMHVGSYPPDDWRPHPAAALKRGGRIPKNRPAQAWEPLRFHAQCHEHTTRSLSGRRQAKGRVTRRVAEPCRSLHGLGGRAPATARAGARSSRKRGRRAMVARLVLLRCAPFLCPPQGEEGDRRCLKPCNWITRFGPWGSRMSDEMPSPRAGL